MDDDRKDVVRRGRGQPEWTPDERMRGQIEGLASAGVPEWMTVAEMSSDEDLASRNGTRTIIRAARSRGCPLRAFPKLTSPRSSAFPRRPCVSIAVKISTRLEPTESPDCAVGLRF